MPKLLFQLVWFNKVVPSDQLMNISLQMAKSIGNNSPNAVSLAKKALNSFKRIPLSEAIQFENQFFAHCC